MRTLFLVLLLACGVSSAAPPENMPSSSGKHKIQQPNGTQNNPFFVQRKDTDGDKAASAEEVKDRKENLSIGAEALKVATDALKATKDASVAANLAATVGVVMAIIAGLQVFMFGWQLLVMRESNKTAAKAAIAAEIAANATKSEFEASHRPWIKVELNLIGDFVRNKSGNWSIGVEFTMTNIGNGVAQNTYPNPGFFAGEGFTDDVLNAQAQLALEFNPVADSHIIGVTIFPGDSFKVVIGIPLTAKTVAEKIAPHVEMGFADCLPPLYIVGSVHYKSTIGTARYRTGFIREFCSSQKAKPGRRILLPQKDVISLDELALGQYIAGDGYID